MASKAMLMLLLTSIFFSCNTSFVQSVELPTFYIEPPSILDPNLAPDESFQVDVDVLDAVDLFGWQVSMRWDSSVLEVVSIGFGDFLGGQPEGTDTAYNIFNDEGWLTAAEVTLGNHSGLDGSGLLCTITFNVKDFGQTALDIFDEFTFYVDSSMSRVGDDPGELGKESGFFSNLGIRPMFDLVIDVVGFGTIDPEPGVYTFEGGKMLDVFAIPDSGWVLDHWEIDGFDAGDDNPITLVIDNDHTLTAVFVERTYYLLIIKVVGSGTIDPGPGEHSFEAMTKVTVDAIPDFGWTFGHWELDGVGVGSGTSITVNMDGNHTLTAVFIEIPSGLLRLLIILFLLLWLFTGQLPPFAA